MINVIFALISCVTGIFFAGGVIVLVLNAVRTGELPIVVLTQWSGLLLVWLSAVFVAWRLRR